MRILAVGSGGREHALVWKLARDGSRPKIYCAPGNAGTAAFASNIAVGAEDVAGLLAWAKKYRPDLTIVGPEAPLCAGLVDEFQAEDLRVFGPSRVAAQLEGSKSFAKDVMAAGGVPTARARSFAKAAEAIDYARSAGAPLVVKADGLAAGKGVTVCMKTEEAERAIREAMVDHAFGEAGRRVVIEEFLEGEEVSILALVDGEHVVMLASAQDHKRVFDNDQGPNTGGMGAYSPAPVVTDRWWPIIREQVFARTLAELNSRGIEYKGVLYAGLMMGPQGPKVLEFNCRFGDPETQVILPRMAGDLVPALEACIDGTLKDRLVQWRPEACACVVLASGGYPGPYAKGLPVDGLVPAASVDGVVVFHAGTAFQDGHVVTAGGRVFGVTGLGADLPAAVRCAYEGAGRIRFEGVHYRKDIAARALRRT